MKTNGVGVVRQLEKNKTRSKCRKWQLRVRTGLNPRTGKYGEKTKIFHGTFREAQAALTAFVDDTESKQHTAPNRKLTFEQLSEEWVKHRLAFRQITQGTANKNKNSLNALSMHIGKMPADKVQTYMVSDAIKALLAGDSPSGKPLSSTYVLMAIQAGNTMYKTYAIPNGLAYFNPFADVERPKIDTEERDPLTSDQESALTRCCTPTDRRYVAVRLALDAGLRRGECCALNWRHVSLIDGIMLVPDTKGGKRLTAIPMRPRLTSYLLEWKEYQCAKMKEVNVKQDENTPVCANWLGDRLDKVVLGRWWTRNREKFGCEGVHFHDLRHTFASNLARNNVHPKSIQALMRHKDDRMAMRVYTHVNVEQLVGAVAGLDS